jgi:hypothetical protein
LSLRTYPNHNQQIFSLTEIVNAELDSSWTKRQIGIIFDTGKRQVNHALRMIADDNRREQPGSPPFLTLEQQQIILHHIREAYRRYEPLPRTQLRSKVLERFNVTPAATRSYEFLNRHSNNITLCRAIPQEESRMNIIVAAARRHIQNMIDFVQNIHTELIFNMDEVGSEEWADRKPKKVFVPIVLAQETLHYAVKRGG